MRESVIVSAVRTPTGKFLGSLKDFTAPQLGAIVVRLQSTHPVAALLSYARSHGVGQIIVGRRRSPRSDSRDAAT